MNIHRKSIPEEDESMNKDTFISLHSNSRRRISLRVGLKAIWKLQITAQVTLYIRILALEKINGLQAFLL